MTKLYEYLKSCSPGPLEDVNAVARRLQACWEELDGHDQTNMRWDKLRRIEQPIWQPPHLTFVIERHGQTVHGSSRATAYTWQVDVPAGKASIVGEKRRQLYAMDKRLDVRPIATSLAEAIAGEAEDPRLKRTKDGQVRIDIAAVIPETNKQTTAARRARLRRELTRLLADRGWREVRANVYVRSDGAPPVATVGRGKPPVD